MNKSKVLTPLWKAFSVSLYGAAAFFPQHPELTNLAGVYAWVMMALGIFMITLIAFLNIGQCLDDPELSNKAKEALRKFKEDSPKYGLISWALFAFSVGCLAWSGLVLTAIIYTLVGLLSRFVVSTVVNGKGE